MEADVPLPPLPANNTKRYFLVVTGPTFTHRMQVRVDSTQDNATAIANFQADMAVLAPVMGDNFSITGLEVAEQGSDIRNVVPGWTVVQGSSGTNPAGQDLTRTFSMRGRSTTGRKVKVLLWGLALPHNDDFEYTPPSESDIAAFIGQVQGHVHSWLAIDGSDPVWAGNLLEDYNDHYEKELRP